MSQKNKGNRDIERERENQREKCSDCFGMNERKKRTEQHKLKES